MNKRYRAFFAIVVLVVVASLLFLLFPPALAFIEMATRELRFLWWLILLVALGIWLIWGFNRKPK